jgi:pseudouridine synthase
VAINGDAAERRLLQHKLMAELGGNRFQDAHGLMDYLRANPIPCQDRDACLHASISFLISGGAPGPPAPPYYNPLRDSSRRRTGMAEERIQKILAAAGFGSRRACEAFIEAGRVRVNGKVAKLGEKADSGRDRITLDDAPVVVEALRYVMLNKPRGVVSSLEPQGNRKTVRDMVPLPGRVYPVGRLDLESEGLVLLTNDGGLTQRLTHPSFGHEKEYEVFVGGHPNQEQLQTWRRGVVLDGEWTSSSQVKVLKKSAAGTWLKVIMREGRKHQIRRTAQAIGLRVKQLKRVRIGPLRLGGLRTGEWRELKPAEVEALRQAARKGKRPRPPRRSGN